MLVVNTTSPATSPSPAKVQPAKAAPSSRTSVALLRPWLRTYSKLRSCSVVYRRSANYSIHDAACQGTAEIRRVGRTADHGLPPDGPLLGEIHEREIRRPPDLQITALTYPPPRRATHRLHKSCQREPATQNQVGIQGGEGRLVTEEPRCGLLQRQLLLFRSVGRVVRSHEVEDTFAQRRLDATTVGGGPQWRIDAVESVQGRDQIVRQGEMVWCGVRGHVGPVLEEADEVGREGRGDVGYVNLRSRLRSQDEGRRGRRVLRAGRGTGEPRE